MPRKSKKSIEEPIVEVSKKVTKRTIKIPSAIAENLRKVETNEIVQDVTETTSDTVIMDTSIVNEENTVVEPATSEVKKQKRTLHLNIGKHEPKVSNETPAISTTNINTPDITEDAFLNEPYLFNVEISNKKEEKEKNEPIINLNSTFFYEPSVFEKYSIDVTETDSPDTVVDLNEVIQNDEIYEDEEYDDYVEEEIIEEVEIEDAPSLNDIISIDDESESIEDILGSTSEEYAEDYEEIIEEYDEDVQDEIIEEEYDENYEEIIDENPEDVQDEIIEEEYDEDYEEIIDEDIEDSLYDDISEDEEYEYVDSDVTSNVINVNFDNGFADETQDNDYEYIEEYDEEVVKESADNLDVPGSNDIPVGKLIENQESASPLFSKPKFDGISHIFKKFSYDETDNLNNENNINNILGTQNNLSDIHQVLGTFETKEQKVTELDVTAEPVGVTIPVIETDTDVFSGETNFSGNYDVDNNGEVLNILSPEAPSTNYEDIENDYVEDYEEAGCDVEELEYDEDYEEVDGDVEELENDEDYEEVDEYVEETDTVGGVENLGGIPVGDISALTKMFESFSETISTLSNRIAELESKNNNANDVVDNNIELTDNIEITDGGDVEVIDEDIKITDEVEEINDGDIEIVDGGAQELEVPEVENTVNEDDPTSDFFNILNSLSQTISELENSASLDKETMENEFTTIDEIINSFTPNSEILEPISNEYNEDETISVEDILEDNSNNSNEDNNNIECTLDKEINIVDDIEDTILPEESNENNEQENNKKLFEVIDDGDYNDSSKFYKKYVPPTVEDNKTLYISEETQKVYFPYTSQDIIEKLNDPLKGYSSVEEVINNEYTVPLSEFRKPIISRFKEAYNFMRTKEKGSISESFDLALELMFNSELDPAIIRAAKNLNELDTYLDCLNEDQLGKFDSFKIKYKKLKKHHK